MQFTFHSLEELREFYNELYPTTSKPPAKKKTTKVNTEAEAKEKVAEKAKEEQTESTSTVTMAELMTYVKTAFAPDATPARSSQELVDMLKVVGAKKVSEIPVEKLDEAMTLLKGE